MTDEVAGSCAVIIEVFHPGLLGSGSLPEQLLAALVAEAEEPMRVAEAERHEGGWRVEVHSDEADLDDLIAALDEVEIDGHRLRGRARLRCVDEARGLRWSGEPARAPRLVFDASLSIGGRLLERVVEWSPDGVVAPADAGFVRTSTGLELVVRRSLFRGPLPRAAGTSDGWAHVGTFPWTGAAPDRVEVVRGSDDVAWTLGPRPALRAPPDRDSLADDLVNLGLREGDTVMVHASMRAVGARTDVLLSALESVVGPSGTLLVLVAADPHQPFHDDVPAWSDLGVFAEAARTRAGWVSHAHPFARFVAWGAAARELLRDVPIDDYYGPGGVLQRLVARGGKVLRLGSDANTTTLFHWAEYAAEIPGSRRVSYTVDVRNGDGEVVPLTARCLDDTDGIFDWPAGDDYFDALLAAVRASSAWRGGMVGRCDADLLDAAEAVTVAVGWLRGAMAEEGRGPSSP